mgnify:CR=1 FL=1
MLSDLKPTNKRIRPVTVSEILVQLLLADISSGNLRPGDQLLPQRKLAQKMGVSNNSVRESLQVLQGMGVIEIRHGVGAFVTRRVDLNAITKASDVKEPITPEDYAKVLEARCLVEVGIAWLAARRITDSQLTAMSTVLNEMNQSLNQKDAVRYSSNDLRFHLLLAEASGNNFLSEFIRLLGERFRKFLETIPYSDVGHIRHHCVLEALRQHDPVASAKAMVRLLESSLLLSVENDLLDSKTHQSLLEILHHTGKTVKSRRERKQDTLGGIDAEGLHPDSSLLLI